ncbi:MAG: hypothetical protein HZB33_12905 [Nitrospirae bacterium]|nr:hypothetical protein [Nitrospirota bacterium]
MYSKKGFNVVGIPVHVVFLAVLAGCASFPPPHENSFFDKEEKVTVRMLKCEDLAGYAHDWDKAFESVNVRYSCPQCIAEQKAVAETAVGILAPLAFDYIKKELNKEAENYVQQFGSTYFGRDFWSGQNGACDQKYYGVEVVRSAAGHTGKAVDNGSAEPAFKLLYGLARDREGFFWASPLFFKTRQAKTKVASWGSSHKIDTKIEIAIDSVWVDDKGKFHSGNVADFEPLMISGYDIDKSMELRPSCVSKASADCGHLDGGLTSFAGVPASANAGGREAGNFWLKVLVTESDTAKTKKYITDLAGLLDKKRDKAVDYIKKQVSP